MANFEDLVQNLRRLQEVGPEAAAAQSIASENLIAALQNAAENINGNSAQVNRNLEFLARERTLIENQIAEKEAEFNASRPDISYFQAQTGSMGSEAQDAQNAWEDSKREEMGLNALYTSLGNATTQIEQHEAMISMPAKFDEMIQRLRNGEELSDDMAKNGSDLIRIQRAQSEKFDEMNKTLKASRLDEKTIQEMWKNLPGKIGEKVSGLAGDLGLNANEMFGSELMSLVRRVGTIGKGVLQRILNPEAAKQEMTHIFGSMRDIISSPGNMLRGLRDAAGLGVSGRLAENAERGRARTDAVRGALGMGQQAASQRADIQTADNTSELATQFADYNEAAQTDSTIYVHDTHVEDALRGIRRENTTSGSESRTERFRALMRRFFRGSEERGLESIKLKKLANFLSKDSLFKLLKVFSKGGLLSTIGNGLMSMFSSGGGLMSLLGKMGGMLKMVAGPVAAVAGVGLTAYNIVDSVKDIHKAFTDPNATTEDKGRAVGGGVGTLVGGGIGGYLGFLIGGPRGAAIGAGLGSTVGKWVGGFIGEKVAPYAAAAWDWVKDTAASVWEGISNFGSWVGDKVSAAWDGITSTITETWDSVTSAVGSAWDSVTGTIGSAWDSLTGAVGSAWDSVTGAVSEGWNVVTEAAQAKLTAVTDTLSSAWDGLKNVGGSVWESVTGWFSSTQEKVSESYKEDGVLGAAWTMLKETNPIIAGVTAGTNKVTSWFKSLFGGEEETEVVTNNTDASKIVSNPSVLQSEINTVNESAATATASKIVQPESLGGKFDTLAELQEKASGLFSSGLNAVVAAIQGIRIPQPVTMGQNTPATIPSDIDSMGMLMTNKIWGAV